MALRAAYACLYELRRTDVGCCPAPQGLAVYLKEHFGDDEARRRGVIIAYDARRHSSEFADVSARVFLRERFRVWLFDTPQPTPIVVRSWHARRCETVRCAR